MTMNFEKAFQKLLGHEGGFVDHPKDPGGATRWGITQRIARKHGYTGNMRDFPVEEAKRIARAMDPHRLAKRYNGLRLLFLTNLGTWSTFGKGWARRVAHNLLES